MLTSSIDSEESRSESDPEVELTTERAMLSASTEREGAHYPFKCIEVDLATVKQKTVADFVTKSSRNVFVNLGMPVAFPNRRP